MTRPAPFSKSLPPANQPVARRLPDFNPPGLPVDIDGPRPNPGQYQPGTADFRYWAAADSLARAAGFWSGRVPAGTKWQADNGPKLVAHLDDGFDFNAFYDRNGLPSSTARSAAPRSSRARART